MAVKLIRSDRLDPVTRARFEKEALIARTVVGTNRVARFLDADPYADRPWLAIEYVPGVTLAAHVESHGPLPAPLVASLGALLAEDLEAVHAISTPTTPPPSTSIRAGCAWPRSHPGCPRW